MWLLRQISFATLLCPPFSHDLTVLFFSPRRCPSFGFLSDRRFLSPCSLQAGPDRTLSGTLFAVSDRGTHRLAAAGVSSTYVRFLLDALSRPPVCSFFCSGAAPSPWEEIPHTRELARGALTGSFLLFLNLWAKTHIHGPRRRASV